MAFSLTVYHANTCWAGRRRKGAGRSVSTFTAALIAIGLMVAAGEYFAPMPQPEASVDARPQGAFTGEFVDGVPVYRLPPITVVPALGSGTTIS